MISLYTKTLATQNRERKFIPMGKEAHSYSKYADLHDVGIKGAWFAVGLVIAFTIALALITP